MFNYIHTLDKSLGRNVPVANLKIIFRLGSNTWYTYTDSNGGYRTSESISGQAKVSIRFEYNEKWRITTEDSHEAHEIYLGEHENNNDGKVRVIPYDHRFFHVHRAVNFYYHGSHAIPKYSIDNGIRIIASERYEQGFQGKLFYPSNGQPYIEIYNKNLDNPIGFLSIVFHELGHFVEYVMKGYDKFSKTHVLIKDGWASYVGWYLGELYYTALGYTFSPGSSKTGESNQSWDHLTADMKSPRIYSPLFVDMRDDFNQHIQYKDGRLKVFDNYVNDEIRDVPHSTIRSIVANSFDWYSCRHQIKSQLGGMYPLATLLNYLHAYDNASNYATIRIWPVPVVNIINFEPENLCGPLEVDIFNTFNRSVRQATYSNVDEGNKYYIDMSGLPSGHYIFEGRYFSGKVRILFYKQ